MAYQTDNSDEDQPAATHMPVAETEAEASAALTPPVLNIVPDATRSPFHALSLPDTEALALIA
jgi:hypothetical protein